MFRNEFKNALIAVSLTLSSGPVVFADTPAPPVDQRRAEYRAQQERINQIQANRQSIIEGIIESWVNEPSVIENLSHWQSEMKAELNKANNYQLLEIQNAASYSEVQAILRGDLSVLGGGQQLLSVSATNNVTATASLADTAADLVFIPVFPCRIFDTRPSKGGVGPYGGPGSASRNYIVYSSTPAEIAEIAAVGGNPAGCPAPKGEPSAISTNFTVVPIDNEGHITAYPYGGNLPTASLVNYYPGTNIANAGIVATAYLQAYDLSVYHHSETNSIADVMGYFYPATPEAAMASGATITDPAGALYAKTGPSDNTIHIFGPSARITITSPGQKVFWTAHHAVGTLAGSAGDLNIYACYKNAVATEWEAVGDGSFNITMLGIQKNIVSESAVVAPGSTGDYDFGLCYITTDTNWNYNESGYVAAQRS